MVEGERGQTKSINMKDQNRHRDNIVIILALVFPFQQDVEVKQVDGLIDELSASLVRLEPLGTGQRPVWTTLDRAGPPPSGEG